MNPFKRVSHKVQEDHKEYSGYGDGEIIKMLGPDFHLTYLALQSHRNECPLCSHPRLYAFGRRVARALQIIRTRILV